MSFLFLSLEQVLEIHARQLAVTGGLAGIRDQQLLEAAVAAPQAALAGGYLHRDLPEMAAAYLFHIAKNHPFFDGNKRVSAEAAIMFIEANGLRFVADPDGLAELVLDVARGTADKSVVADYVRRNVVTDSS